MGYTKMSTLLMVIVVGMVATRVAEGQSIPSCGAKLVACANYLNSTKPPASCCNPLREAVTNDLTCLCNLYNTPGFLASLGINVTQAILLPDACGIPSDQSACPGATAPTSPSKPAPPAPPGVPENNVGRIASTGMLSFLLIWASMMIF